VRGNTDIPDDLLLSHSRFLRSLARSLIDDEHEADDLAQEAMVRALEVGPREPEALSGWLRTVTRNLAFKRMRTRARVRHREEEAAHSERLPSAADLVERESSLQGVVSAVLDLPEHYRRVVLMRYFEGLPPRKIAAQLGEQVTTVRTRLHRALRLLREKLDKEYGGDRERWVRALVVLVGVGRPVGVVLVLAVLGLLAAAGIAFAFWRMGSTSGSAGTAQTTSAPALLVQADRGDVLGDSDPVQPQPPAATTQADEEVLGLHEFVGALVLDADGLPVAKAQVFGEWGRAGMRSRGRTDQDGRLVLRVPRPVADAAREGPPLQLAARATGHAPSRVTTWTGVGDVELRLRWGAASLAGVVHDGARRPVEGASLRLGAALRLGRGYMGALERDPSGNVGPLLPGLAAATWRTGVLQLDPSVRGFLGPQIMDGEGRLGRLPPGLASKTDPTGRFAFTGLEPGPQPLYVAAPGFITRVLEVDPADGEVQVQLERGARVEGWVTRADGLRLSQTYVYALGEARRGVEVGEDGHFVLDGLPEGVTTLYALGEEGSDSVQQSLSVDETCRWSPVISGDLGVRGVLTGPDGVLADWRLELRASWNPGRPICSTTTGSDGGFEVAICPPESRLYAAPPGGGSPVVSIQVQGGDELMPWSLEPEEVQVGRLMGSLVRPDGTHVPPGTGLLIRRVGDREAVLTRVGRSGRFESPPLGPGRWCWMLPGEGLLAGPEDATEVLAGDLELGEIVLGSLGTLALAVEPGNTRLRLERAAGSDWVLLFDGRAAVPARIPLAPGRWQVTIAEGWPRTVYIPPRGEVRVE
jgi:RNA polymerase sigma-70 factor (ECF subfamily)